MGCAGYVGEVTAVGAIPNTAVYSGDWRSFQPLHGRVTAPTDADSNSDGYFARTPRR
jgi:hypothetical protein